MTKIIQSRGFLGALLGKLAVPLMKVAFLLTENVRAPLTTMTSASVICGAIQQKILGRGVVRAGREITSFILNGDMDDIRITKSPENSCILIDGVSKTVRHELKKQEGRCLGILFWTLDASRLGDMFTKKGVVRAERGYSIMDHMDKMI